MVVSCLYLSTAATLGEKTVIFGESLASARAWSSIVLSIILLLATGNWWLVSGCWSLASSLTPVTDGKLLVTGGWCDEQFR